MQMDPKQNVKPYVYKPLRRPESIRILSLHPATDFAAPLLCELNHDDRKGILNDFSRERYYNTVSYTWGDAVFSHEILCEDGTSSMVTAHVDSMLRHLRKPHRSVLLWIDAICLNQADNEEKAVQVQLMDEIYRYARKMHIWLGDGDDADAVAVFQFIQCGLIQKTPPEDPDERYTRRPRFAENPMLLSMLSRAPFSSVEKLLRLPWFQRRWVIQEAALSSATTVHWGSRKTSWNLLLAGLRMLEFRAVAQVDSSTLEILRTTCALGVPHRNILDLLWEHHAAECFDPRDRLFSLFSLAKDVTNRNLGLASVVYEEDAGKEYYDRRYNREHRDEGPSYTIAFSEDSDSESRSPSTLDCSRLTSYEHDWFDVYRLFTKECLRVHHVEDITRHLFAFGSSSARDPHAASWVPDWSNRRHDGTLAAANSFQSDLKLSVTIDQPAHELKIGSRSQCAVVERTLRGGFWSRNQVDFYHFLVLHPLLDPNYDLAQALVDGLDRGYFNSHLVSSGLRKVLGMGSEGQNNGSGHDLRIYLTKELGREKRDPKALAFFSNLMETHSFYVCEDGSAGIGPTNLRRGDLIGFAFPFSVQNIGRDCSLSPILRPVTPVVEDVPRYRIAGYVIHQHIRGPDRGFNRERSEPDIDANMAKMLYGNSDDEYEDRIDVRQDIDIREGRNLYKARDDSGDRDGYERRVVYRTRVEYVDSDEYVDRNDSMDKDDSVDRKNSVDRIDSVDGVEYGDSDGHGDIGNSVNRVDFAHRVRRDQEEISNYAGSVDWSDAWSEQNNHASSDIESGCDGNHALPPGRTLWEPEPPKYFTYTLI
jgi:hypothetical protein